MQVPGSQKKVNRGLPAGVIGGYELAILVRRNELLSLEKEMCAFNLWAIIQTPGDEI